MKLAKKISWMQAGILGISDRTMRRWKYGYEKHGFSDLGKIGGTVHTERSARPETLSEFFAD